MVLGMGTVSNWLKIGKFAGDEYINKVQREQDFINFAQSKEDERIRNEKANLSYKISPEQLSNRFMSVAEGFKLDTGNGQMSGSNGKSEPWTKSQIAILTGTVAWPAVMAASIVSSNVMHDGSLSKDPAL